MQPNHTFCRQAHGAGPTVARWLATAALVAFGGCFAESGPADTEGGENDVGAGDTGQVSSDQADFDQSPADQPATADTPATIEVANDTGSATDSAAVDASADSGDCPGAPGCVCTANSDCQSGFCIDTPNGKACAQKCVSQCPAEFSCVLVNDSSGDTSNICVPAAGKLCNPCAATKECEAIGLANSLCVDQGNLGAYCGITCVTKSQCPSGYDCKQVKSIEGVAANQCVRLPESATGTAGVCSCSPQAVTLALGTACSVNAADASGKLIGTCKGQRKCTAAGLTPCSAPPAVAETCDGLDNDCDAKIDNGACDDKNACTQDACDPAAAEGKKCSHTPTTGPCDADGSLCTEGDTCAAGKCLAGKTKPCDDANPCSTDSCDPALGCVSTPDNGAPCDDENLCTVGDKCFANKCQSGGSKECSSSDSCVDAKCSQVDGKCKFTNKPEGLSCDDGTGCTKDDACAGGACAGKVFSCADGNPCTDDSCDAVLGCLYKLNNAPCTDSDACTIGDTCKAALCAAGVAKPCDDGNACTTDTCDKSSGACVVAPQSLPCNDGNACTMGDLCKAGVCAPGLGKDCGDNNACTADLCDAANGGCANLANDASCTDGDPCTTGDACAAGACKPSAAKNCADSDPCTADACDAATGACNSKQIAGCGGNCTAASDCDDNNPCTDNKCLPGAVTSKCAFAPNSAPCSDANACTLGDLCGGGVCGAGGAKNCDDSNPCTADSCDKATGVCANAATSAPCSDNNSCTEGDSCSAAKCVSGKVKACDDTNPCTSDTCQPDSGDCAFAGQFGGCDDANPCTVGDACAAGKCQAGGAKDCNDNNPCTGDSCSAGTCAHVPVAANCDDGNLCTAGDACAKGACAAGAIKSCDDGNLCTDDACDSTTGGCSSVQNKAPCSDGNACTAPDQCAGGTCAPGASKVCDDKDPCTADTCNLQTGACVYGPIAGCGGNCMGPQDCSDKNECTTDACAGGKCSFPANFALCEDGNPCTLTDKCSGGTCTPGLAKVCDDANPCSDDSCDLASGKCAQKANAAPCSDGNLCTIKDLCVASACKPGNLLACSDGNPCTDDSCAPNSGNCGFANNAATCADNDACTLGDSCTGGTCKAGAAKVCDDNNPCTADSCDPATGNCANAANTAPCSDGNACTLGDQCAGKACKAGALKSCDDGNGCTNDTCDSQLGVCQTVANTAPCSDNNACTLSDVCKANVCQPGSAKLCSDGDNCTSDNCDKANGLCGFVPIIGCGGNCKGATDCDDGNPCTDNSCPSGKCAFAANTIGCSDNNPCTLSDTCSGGKCLPGAVKACNDNNPCTTDSCDVATGSCVLANNTAVCTDGNACTLSDTCKGGLCLPGSTKVCGDNNTCTDDSCNSATGACVYTANAASCNDANACTSGDTCKGSACGSGAAVNCDDSNACTTDSCSATSGCTHGNTTIACEDGNACTTGDVCAAGACKPGAAKSCDDSTMCTTDSCNPASGCSNLPIDTIYKDCSAVLDKGFGDGVYCIDPDGKGVNAPVQTFCDIQNGGWTLMSHRAKYTEQSSCTLHTEKAVAALKGPTASSDAKLHDTIVQSFVNATYRFDGDWVGGPIRHYWLLQQPWTSQWQSWSGPSPAYKCTLNAADWPTSWTTSANPGAYPLGNTTCKGAGYSTIWFHIGQDACAYIGDPGKWEWRNLGAGSGPEAYVNLWVRSGACKVDGECDDKNACTTDSCDAVKGVCAYANNTAPCSDGDGCTTTDQCSGGKCSGVAKSCDDGNPCTTDSCTAPGGTCANANNTKVCDDANACTTGDSCSSGACKPGTAKTCTDGNDCTTDSCDAASGACKFAANGFFCPDFSLTNAAFDVSSAGGLTVAGTNDAAGKLTQNVFVQCFQSDGTAVKPSVKIGTVLSSYGTTAKLARSRLNGISFITWQDMQSWPNPPTEWETYAAVVDAQCNVLSPQTRLELTTPKGIIRWAEVAASDADLGAYFYEHQSMGQFRLVVTNKAGVVQTAIDAGKDTCGNGALSRSMAMQRSTGLVVLACEKGVAGGADRYFRRFQLDGVPVDPTWVKVAEAKNSTWHNFAVVMSDDGHFALAAGINSAQIVTFFDAAANKLASKNIGVFTALDDRQITTAGHDTVWRLQNEWARYQPAGNLVASKPAPHAVIRLDAKDTVYRVSGKAIVKEPLGL